MHMHDAMQACISKLYPDISAYVRSLLNTFYKFKTVYLCCTTHVMLSITTIKLLNQY